MRYPLRDLLKMPSRSELRWAALVAAAVMVLTCAFYLYGFAVEPEGMHYSGLLTNPDEHNVYLSYMRQAFDGRLFFLDPFTAEPQQGRVVNVFFLALGRFARLTSLPLDMVYRAARFASGWLLLMAIYCLGAQVLSSVPLRRAALLVAAFASGLGWAYPHAAGRPHPVDFGPGLVMPEAITFLSLLLNPLFCFSIFLMIAAVGLSAHAFTAGSVRSAALAGAAALLLGNIHTYDLVPVVATLTLFLMWLLVTRLAPARALLLAALSAAIGAPSVLYQLWLIRGGEVTLAVKAVETPVASPDPALLALGLGLPLALAVAGIARSMLPTAPVASRLLSIWLVVGFALVYLPVPYQRKLAEGLHVPTCLLAVFALAPLLSRLSAPRRIWAVVLLLAVTVPSNALFAARAVRDLRTNNTEYLGNLMPPLYLRDDQYGALRWLSENASFDDVLLCNSFLGSYAPSLAGSRVYVGHWAETLRFREKLSDVSRFLRASTPDGERRAFVARDNITYVLRDRSIYDEVFCLGEGGKIAAMYEPDESEWLLPVFAQGDVSVYRVK